MSYKMDKYIIYYDVLFMRRLSYTFVIVLRHERRCCKTGARPFFCGTLCRKHPGCTPGFSPVLLLLLLHTQTPTSITTTTTNNNNNNNNNDFKNN